MSTRSRTSILLILSMALAGLSLGASPALAMSPATPFQPSEPDGVTPPSEG